MRAFILPISIKKIPYLSFFNHKGDEIKFKHWVAGSNPNLGLDAREPVIFKKKQIRFPFIENTGVPLKNDSYNVHKIYLKFSSKIGMITFFVNFIKIKHNKQKPKVFIFSISIMSLYKRLKYTVIAIF